MLKRLDKLRRKMGKASGFSNFVLASSLVTALILCPGADASETKIQTLREAVKSGNIKLKLNGDSVNTSAVSLQLTNTTDEPLKVVIPANESLKPNKRIVQTMVVRRDLVVTVLPGKTAIFTLETVCASPKSVAPPPPVTEGLEFEVTDYSNPETWKKISKIIAAGRELERAGAYGNLMFPSEAAMKARVDQAVSEEVDDRIKLLQKENKALTRSEAEEIVKKGIDEITKKAEREVLEKEKRKRQTEIIQLAIWKVLGDESSESKDKVSAESIERDILKELATQIKMDKTLLAKLGGKLSKQGEYIPTTGEKKALDDKTSTIFEVVNLTVNRSSEAGLTEIANVPSNDSCSTFCDVGERAFHQGDYAEAQELLTTALEEAETFGEADPRLSRCLNSLGSCYLDMTSYTKAESMFNRALSLREKVFGENSKEVGEVTNNLGLMNQQQQHYPKAEEFFVRAEKIFDKTTGKTSNSVAQVLNNLGRNHNLLEQAPDAKLPLTKALSFGIINSPKDLKGNSLFTPFVAEVETNLGDTYVQLGQYDRASALYKKALTTNQKQLGENHPFIAKIFDGLAAAAEKSGQKTDADKFEDQAEHIREQSLGSDNRELAMLPLSYDAFTRIRNFVEGKKEIAANVDNLRAAAKVASTRTYDKAKINRPIKDKWALVVGISKFEDPSINLQYASKDAKDFAEFLVEEANFAPDHVRLLTDEKATREEIMSQLGDKWLPLVANPDDLVVIYFSSHGSPTQMDVNSVNYLVAHNTNTKSLYATGIPLQQFADTIKDRVHSDRVVVFMDACHSGAAIGAKGIFRQFGVDANEVAQGTGQMVICSSGANQTSWESTRYDNGVFTHHLIEGLRKNQKLGTAFDFLKSKVQEEVQRDRNGEVQTPVLQSKWRGDDLIFTTPPTEPRSGIE